MGLLIIVGAGALKLPQIYKIVSSGSVQGIAKSMFYLETVIFLQSASYSMKQGIPFSVYGENLIILAQNLVIILLFWTYSKHIGLGEKVGLFVFLSAYSFVLFSGERFITNEQWQIVQSSNMVL